MPKLFAAFAFSPALAWGQADNASGTMERATLSGAGVSPLGTWVWKCCRGGHSGTFTLQELLPDGTARGVFGNPTDERASPMEGSCAAMSSLSLATLPSTGAP